MDFFVLEDDRHYFPPYEAVPVIREQTLQQHPEVARALAELAGKISDDECSVELRRGWAASGHARSRTQVSETEASFVVIAHEGLAIEPISDREHSFQHEDGFALEDDAISRYFTP